MEKWDLKGQSDTGLNRWYVMHIRNNIDLVCVHVCGYACVLCVYEQPIMFVSRSWWRYSWLGAVDQWTHTPRRHSASFRWSNYLSLYLLQQNKKNTSTNTVSTETDSICVCMCVCVGPGSGHGSLLTGQYRSTGSLTAGGSGGKSTFYLFIHLFKLYWILIEPGRGSIEEAQKILFSVSWPR